MEGKKYIITLFALVSMLSIFASENYKTRIYKAYINNQMPEWKKIINELNAKEGKTPELILELVNYQYGYIAWCIGNKKTKEADTYLQICNRHCSYLENKKYEPSIVKSYKSALLGFEIGLNKIKAPFLGPQSVDAAKEAMALDKSNPYAYLQYGNALFYMPKMVGGSKELGIENYLTAERLMEKDIKSLKNDWNYLSLLVTIGNAYLKIENTKMAKLYYTKALKVEPNFAWVKNELLPQLKQ